MTAIAAWVRKFPQGPEELCIISDSRLRGDGRTIDMAPKILSFPRGDMVLGFAGDTGIAYPFLQQLVFTCESFRAARTRALDIIEYRSHILKILNDMVNKITVEVKDISCSECEFILAGYSWIKKDFKIWKIYFSKQSNSYTYQKCGTIGGISKILMAGSDASLLNKKLAQILTDRRGKNWNMGGALDFEPLEAMAAILKVNNKDSSIGGAPQLVKVYQYLKTLPVPLIWEYEKGKPVVTILGRPLMGYENFDNWALNPITLKKIPPRPERHEDHTAQ